MSRSHIPEGMVKLTHALVEDAGLRAWFVGLARLSRPRRNTALAEMVAEMRREREDPELVWAVDCLIHPGIYESILGAVRERCFDPSGSRAGKLPVLIAAFGAIGIGLFLFPAILFIVGYYGCGCMGSANKEGRRAKRSS